MQKYRSKKTSVDGLVFDSRREAARWQELRLLERAGSITELERQVSYTLIPPQRIGKRVAERAVTYIADFRYRENGETVVEDAKGMRTRDYIIKRKLMLYVHGIRIREV